MQERIDVIESMRKHRTELKEALSFLGNTLLGHGFVVVTSEILAMRFSILNGRASDPKVCRATIATRFTKGDAERLAALVQDGNGKHAEAVHIRTLLSRQIANLDECIETLERAEAQEKGE